MPEHLILVIPISSYCVCLCDAVVDKSINSQTNNNRCVCVRSCSPVVTRAGTQVRWHSLLVRHGITRKASEEWWWTKGSTKAHTQQAQWKINEHCELLQLKKPYGKIMAVHLICFVLYGTKWSMAKWRQGMEGRRMKVGGVKKLYFSHHIEM